MWLSDSVFPSSFVYAAKDDAHLPSPRARCSVALPARIARAGQGSLSMDALAPAKPAGSDYFGSAEPEVGMLGTG